MTIQSIIAGGRCKCASPCGINGIEVGDCFEYWLIKIPRHGKVYRIRAGAIDLKMKLTTFRNHFLIV